MTEPNKQSPNEQNLPLTQLQYEMLERVEQELLQARARVDLVYNTILAGHDIGTAEVVKIEGDAEEGRRLLVRVPKAKER